MAKRTVETLYNNPIRNEDIDEFLKEHCVRNRGLECRTLGCFLNDGWDGNRDNLDKFSPTCEAFALGKVWYANLRP